jgi:hypothetical protein
MRFCVRGWVETITGRPWSSATALSTATSLVKLRGLDVLLAVRADHEVAARLQQIQALQHVEASICGGSASAPRTSGCRS